MKVGDLVYHRDREGAAAPLGDGLIIEEYLDLEEWENGEKPQWRVLWSKAETVFNHYTAELRVTHEGG